MAPIKAFVPQREGRYAAFGFAALAALGLAGCSMPIPGFIDATPTGSVKSRSYPFAEEDWAKAEPALLAAAEREGRTFHGEHAMGIQRVGCLADAALALFFF